MTKYDLDLSRVPEGGAPMTEPDPMEGICAVCDDWAHVEEFAGMDLGPICRACWGDKFPGVPYGESDE